MNCFVNFKGALIEEKNIDHVAIVWKKRRYKQEQISKRLIDEVIILVVMRTN